MTNKKYNTPEEAYAAHVARVIQWQKDNKDAYYAYKREYYSRDEVRQKYKDNYANMDPEDKEVLLERMRIFSRERYHKLKKENPEEHNKWNKEHKEEILEYQRKRYAEMDPVAKAELLQKRREYTQRKKKERDENSSS